MRLLTDLTNIEKAVRERIDIYAPLDEVYNTVNESVDCTFPLVGLLGLMEECIKMECLHQEAPHRVMWKMDKGPKVLESFTGCWRFLYIDENHTVVICQYRLTMAHGYGWLEPLMRNVMRYQIHQCLRGLGERMHNRGNRIKHDVMRTPYGYAA